MLPSLTVTMDSLVPFFSPLFTLLHFSPSTLGGKVCLMTTSSAPFTKPVRWYKRSFLLKILRGYLSSQYPLCFYSVGSSFWTRSCLFFWSGRCSSIFFPLWFRWSRRELCYSLLHALTNATEWDLVSLPALSFSLSLFSWLSLSFLWHRSCPPPVLSACPPHWLWCVSKGAAVVFGEGGLCSGGVVWEGILW